MKSATLTVLVLLLFAAPAHASDVALLVDVSGSMAGYGTWQPDAAQAIQSILETGALDHQLPQWSLSGDPALAKQFKLLAGERLQLIKFGSIHAGVSTFFPIQTINSAADLGTVFPSMAEFRDARTNKELAIAVAVKTLGSQSAARVISVSDFLSDANLNKQQQEFVNSVMQGTSIENKLVFSWNRDPRVMIRLQKIDMPTNTQGRLEKGTLELMPASLDSRSKVLTLGWRSTGPKPTAFDIKVSTSDGTVLLARTNLITSEVLLNDPPGGELTWTVTAHYSGGAVTTASRQEMLPEGGELIRKVMVAGLIGVLILAGFLLLRKHGDSMIASMRRILGRSGGPEL